MASGLTCFKAYDIRGELGRELNEGIAYRIGRAFGQYLEARQVVIGGDVRESSPALKAATSEGLRDAGADVVDLGLTGTEEIYFACAHLGVDGGIEITASHNPITFNGMKLVREGARPISGDSGLREIQRLAEENQFEPVSRRGSLGQARVREAYVEHLLGYVQPSRLKPLRLVVNAGNGAAGPVIDALEARLVGLGAPLTLFKVNHEPDGRFPNGIPNPLLPENRGATRAAVLTQQADLGIAWDGDFDRCFLFDEQGRFIEGYYIVGLLAEAFLQDHPGERIVHDPRLTWNTLEVVERAGGIAVQSKTGHAFIKERMRAENAIYGGEMSAHHYFRDFAYCDSGMIPWLLVVGLMSRKGQPLSRLVAERMAAFPASGEINAVVADGPEVMQQVERTYARQARHVDRTDGLSMAFDRWRFNLRMSNTEPVIRLNVESRGDVGLMEAKTRELLTYLRG